MSLNAYELLLIETKSLRRVSVGERFSLYVPALALLDGMRPRRISSAALRRGQTEPVRAFEIPPHADPG
jgi:hypothetical protein